MNPVEYGLGVYLASATRALDGLFEVGVLKESSYKWMIGVLLSNTGQWIRDNRNGGHCEECGRQFKKTKLQRHHIIPKSSGGDDMPWNIQLLCEECHDKKHGKGKKL